MNAAPALVVDTGAATTKAGFASDDHPRAVLSTAVARPRGLCGRVGKEHYEVFIGDEADSNSETMQLSRPLEDGRVASWDDLERVWHHVFYRELRVAPEERPLLLAVIPMCPLEDKVRICEIMFETLNVPSLFLESQCVLALYASGRTSGVVVDSGCARTHVLPVADGNPVRSAHAAHPLAGDGVTRHLRELLAPRRTFAGTWDEFALLDTIKRKCARVRLGDEDVRPEPYALPDGEIIDVGEAAAACIEPLFRPDRAGSEFRSLPEEIALAVAKCDADAREELLDNVVACGGNSLLRNFPERLQHETRLAAAAASAGGGAGEARGACAVTVHAATERLVYPWLGGSIFAGMPESKKYWLQKKQFEESGVRIVKNKFL